MNKYGLGVLLLFLVGLAPIEAQVSVEIRLEQDQFLQDEPIPIAIRITNRSGQQLNLGGEDDWLTFSITTTETGMVPRFSDPPVAGEFTLGSSKVATKRVDLAPYFSFDKPGTYTLTATIRIKQWGSEIVSPSKPFTIIQGAPIWQQEFGLPKKGATSSPEVRRYVLQQANYIRGQIRMYLRVISASDGKTIKVTPVGRMLSFSRPEAQVDQDSNLHLLYQTGARAFSYFVYNPDGEVIRRQSYDYEQTRPRLHVDADSEIGVKGGTRHVLPTDIPAPKTEDSAKTDESPDKPAATAPPQPQKE